MPAATIPPPCEHDRHIARRLIERAIEGDLPLDVAVETVAQLHAEVRWLHTIVQTEEVIKQ